MGHHILKLIQALQPDVGHADFLPLVNKGSATLQHVHGGQHFAALHTVPLAAVAADNARMVVVFNVKGIPGLALQLFLPVREGALHLAQVEGRLDHVGHEAVRFHVRKGDHFVQHFIRPFGYISQRDIRRGHGAFADSKAVVVVQHIVLELLQIAVRLRLVGVVLDAVGDRELRPGVGQTGSLADVSDHVFPEAVHAHIQPEPENVLDFLAHFRIRHVQVRLLFRKQVQVVLAQVLVVFPGVALKHARPVVRRQAPAAADPAVPPDVIVVIGVVVAFPALLKPGVLVRSVVYHQVHKDPQAHSVGTVQNLFEHLQIAVIRMDVRVV